MKIYCAACQEDVQARLTNGTEIYPHRPDLSELPFWCCDGCGGFVGCHHKTKNRTRPLGCIPTNLMKQWRKKIHAVLDPIWQSGRMTRKEVYQHMTDRMGWRFHTAKTRSIYECDEALQHAYELAGIECVTTGVNE